MKKLWNTLKPFTDKVFEVPHQPINSL